MISPGILRSRWLCKADASAGSSSTNSWKRFSPAKLITPRQPSQNAPLPLVGLVVVSLVFVGLVAAAAGLGALARALRWRRALAAVPSQRGLLRIAGPAIVAFEPEGYDEWDPDDEPVRLTLVSTSVWRTRQVQGLDGGEVRAAPVGSGQWVLTAEGLPTLYGARTARRSR